MKVNIYETIEISGEDRLRLGAVLSGQQKPKYNATRDEIKQFVWENGEGWEDALTEAFNEKFSAPEEEDDADDYADDDYDGDSDDDLI